MKRTSGTGRDAGSLDATVARMREVGAGCPPPDGVGVFNSVYLTVTEELARRIGAGAFPDVRAASTLTTLFAGRYLDAVAAEAAGERVPACWRPLFAQRRHPGVRPLQFALAGIQAHVGHDLPLAVVDSCRALGCRPAALEDEFDTVGEVLRSLEERVREELMPGPDLLELADPLTHLAGAWSLDRARDGAWAAARTLWVVRGVEELGEEFVRRLDTSVGLVARMLLTPLRR
ncbi:hypothetical protein IPZ55_27530 [Streptomyces sp. A10(2020)]|uniref:DUF5995 family protein n=1 Tax=Streptomyces sp. A10(2020) TaxID=2782013 RepID=UPI001F5C19D3|nr:DUF5995 family protein [Streptomyces sp. A10(2020)]UNR60026.1 hypothetical protein IPZ55_27530 [Streptomyces sp. A10(2020)]